MSIVARLEAPGLDTLALDPWTGYVIQALDLGDAETRVVAEDAPGADGTIDTTAFTGARPVMISLKLVPAAGRTKEQMRRRLRSFTHPQLRPVLYFQIDGGPDQQITLRRSAWSSPMQSSAYANVGAQWVAPFGIIESAELHVVVAPASASGGEGGRTYDLTFDRTYSGGVVIGETTVTNNGNADAYPLIRIYGPVTEPVLTNVTQNKSLVFVGLTVLAGEFLEVDTRNKTIRYLGLASDSRYSKLSFPLSSWWTLSPGDNTIRFLPATFTAPANAEISYRDAWL